MAKIIYDDWTEKEFNQDDFISREDLAENYVSKDDIEDNYVSKEKYDKVKAQRKELYKKNAELENSKEVEVKSEWVSKDEIMFSVKHCFDWDIPQEIADVKAKHPTLSRDEALNLSGYQVATGNPNPWIANPKAVNGGDKTEYKMEELANLSQSEYNDIMAKVDAGQIKLSD